MDPITCLFGKDVALLIYRHRFQLCIKDVNEQYHDFLLPITPTSSIGVRFSIDGLYYYCVFNYRNCAKIVRHAYIYTFRCSATGWRGMTTKTVNLLPRNY